jgi:hypothetical protein
MDGSEHWTNERAFSWRRITPVNDVFELRGSSGRIATLAVGGLMQIEAHLMMGNKQVTFTAEGIGGQLIRILDGSTDTVVASFSQFPPSRSGTLRFPHGGQLEWRRKGWRRPVHLFTDRFGNPLMRFEPNGSVSWYGLGTELDPLIHSHRDLLVLLSLGWLLLVMAGSARPLASAG